MFSLKSATINYANEYILLPHDEFINHMYGAIAPVIAETVELVGNRCGYGAGR